LNTALDKEGNFLYAKNFWNAEFGNQIIAVGSNLDIQDFTTDRGFFLGSNSGLDKPAALANNKNKSKPKVSSGLTLSRKLGFGFDSAAILKYEVTIPKKGENTLAFYVSIGDNLESLRDKAKSISIIPSVAKKEKKNIENWKKEISPLHVQTPSTSFDTILNGWLLYQTLSCRIKARTGFFQSSGAIGFRDQLQDSMAFILSKPEYTRKQILINASRQFEEGDVQHWWHPPSGRGIRNRISDNYMWMPLAVTDYLEATGKLDILDERTSYLKGPILDEHQHDLYFTPEVSSESGSLYEHCIKALDRSYKRGPNGLPLMGAGDWNDGMNLVGEKGTGESVWLAWFFAYILNRFSKVCITRGDTDLATKYTEQAKELVIAIENNAWDGEWYKRAYFDDGTPLGSKSRDECFIDSLAQSWSALTGLGDPERRKIALDSALKYLFDRDHQLVRLLWPPFQNSNPSPGYIQSYPPGIRENGGQYTHGSTWLIGALCEENRCDEAYEVFQAMNPINHTDSVFKAETYKTEPYVTCGDVYSYGEHAGRGGWSWYTGSSGWMYQMGWTWILGIKRTKDGLLINPKIPTDWHEYSVSGELDDIKISLKVVRAKKDCIKVGNTTVDDKLISWDLLKESAGAEIVVEFV
jgi:cellobiose phosphorylase